MKNKYKFSVKALFLALVFLAGLGSQAQAQTEDPCNANPLSFANNVATASGSTVGLPWVFPNAACGTAYGFPSAGSWYVFNGTGNAFTVSTCGSDFDTRVRVYTYLSGGSCSTLLCQADNDNSDDCGIGSLQSQVTFNTIATRVYYILIDGQLFTEGNYVLTVTEDVPPPTCTLAISENNLPDFCQGGVNLTVDASETGSTFGWTLDVDPAFAATGESILTTQSGTYTVTAVGGPCDGLTATYSVSVTPQNLLSAYTILATEEVHLHGNVDVLNGGVGVFNTDKELKVHESSNLTGATTFGMATLFDITNGSVVTNQITGVPGAVLPDFLVMPYGVDEIEVPENGYLQATGTAYKKVKLKKNATIVFTEDNVSIKEFETDDNAIVKFSGCTYMYVVKKFKVDKGTVFNPDNFEVTAYVDNLSEDKVEIKEGAVFNGNIYATGEVKVKGKEPKDGNPAIPTYFNGMVIGKKVKGEKYAVFNWDLNCDNTCTASGTAPTNKQAPVVADQPLAIELIAYPNPFTDKLSIELHTSYTYNVEVAVYSLTGTLVELHRNLPYDEPFEIGERLVKGVYIVVISQNGNKVFERVVKQ